MVARANVFARTMKDSEWGHILDSLNHVRHVSCAKVVAFWETARFAIRTAGIVCRIVQAATDGAIGASCPR